MSGFLHLGEPMAQNNPPHHRIAAKQKAVWMTRPTQWLTKPTYLLGRHLTSRVDSPGVCSFWESIHSAPTPPHPPS